ARHRPGAPRARDRPHHDAGHAGGGGRVTSIPMDLEPDLETAARARAGVPTVSRSRATMRIVQYVLRDVMRGRWLVAYAGFFLLVTEALVRFGGGGTRALLSLTNVALL